MDEAFEHLLDDIFGSELMSSFKKKRPAGFIDLMIAFESRKRSCSPHKLTPLNVALPFSFIDFYKKTKGNDVRDAKTTFMKSESMTQFPFKIGSAFTKYGHRGISWASHGMMRMDVKVMRKLFERPVQRIMEVGDKKGIDSVHFICSFHMEKKYIGIIVHGKCRK